MLYEVITVSSIRSGNTSRLVYRVCPCRALANEGGRRVSDCSSAKRGSVASYNFV